MGKRPTRWCVYCRLERATDNEHVFPRSWYPTSTPGELTYLTVPSCRPCNERWKKIEERLGETLIALCDAEHPDAAGIFERVTRSWDASRGKNPQDAKFRE